MSSTALPALLGTDYDDEKVLRTYFDEIMDQGQTNNDEYLYEIINQLTTTDLLCLRQIDHPIFILIRDAFVIILQNPDSDFRLLCHIGQLFSKMADHVDDKNIHLFQQLFTDVTLIECLDKHLKTLSSTSSANLISGIGNMIDAYQKFQQDRPSVKDNPILSSLIMPIVNFVKSPQYITSFFQLSIEQDELTAFQKLILVTCPKYIVSFWCAHQTKVALATAQETLSRASEILKQFLPFIDDWNETIMWCIFYLIWLCQYSTDAYLLSAYHVQHGKILDCVLEIVQGKELWQLVSEKCTPSMLQKRASQLFCYSTLYIYATSFLTELRCKLKEKKITSILVRLTKADFDKTQFHAYRILAVILSSDDIKHLTNASQITAVFVTYLNISMNISSTRPRLENLLVNLKSLVQHDQIKAEFVEQTDGLPLLLQCATESRFDPAKIHLRAIEVLMCLTFNNEAKVYLKQNNTFVQYMRSLTLKSPTPSLQRAADAILWRLFPKNRQTNDEFQYDIMISYSHKDKDICYQIHQALVADNFRVWIDIEKMHGVLMQAMADAIEQSRYIVICISDNYYLSPYCQAEAQYAFEKRRNLIPLRTQSGYRADGWLAFFTTGRMYVDFTKRNFDVAYAQLVLQVNGDHACDERFSSLPLESNVSKLSIIRQENVLRCYSTDVLQWISTDVYAFLLEKHLNQMMPVCKL